jgi:hypothetical protein
MLRSSRTSTSFSSRPGSSALTSYSLSVSLTSTRGIAPPTKPPKRAGVPPRPKKSSNSRFISRWKLSNGLSPRPPISRRSRPKGIRSRKSIVSSSLNRAPQVART